MRTIFTLLFAALFSTFAAAQPAPPSGGSGQQLYNPSRFAFLGDSRMQYLTVAAGNAVTAQQWFNVANARLGHRFTLGVNAAGSGCRSDQFLAQINVKAAIADPGQYVLINSPAANDFAPLVGNGTPATVGAGCSNSGGAFPYTNNNGVSVTSSNVGQIVAQNVINAAEQIIRAGKTVILTEEPGTTALTATGVAQVYDLNFRLRAYAAAKPRNVLLFSYNSAVWNPTASATAFGFKTNFSTDGTHFALQGAYAQATAFIAFWQGPVPVPDLSIANINFVNTTTTRSLTTNPLFTTLTGGTAGGSCGGGITGNVPSGFTLSCGNAGTAVTVTSGAEPNGFGNQITLAITTSAADTGVTLSWAPTAGQYNLTDYIYGGADISVAAGSSNAACYMQTANVSNLGSTQQYDLFPNSAGAYGNTAYAFRMQSLPKQALTGSSTKSFLNPATVTCSTTAAGNVTVTISRVWGAKAYIYNPATGQFSG